MNYNLFLFLLISSATLSNAQSVEVTRDLGLWTSFSVNRKVAKKTTLSFSPQMRLFRDMSTIERFLGDIEIKYKIDNKFRIGGSYRYEYKTLNSFVKNNHNMRYNLDFMYRLKFEKKWRLDYRLRYQKKYLDLFTGNNDQNRPTKTTIRNKLKISKKYGAKHRFFFSTELFREATTFRRTKFNNIRFLIGDQIDSKIGQFNFALGEQNELNEENALSLFFIKLNYTLEWKRK